MLIFYWILPRFVVAFVLEAPTLGPLSINRLSCWGSNPYVSGECRLNARYAFPYKPALIASILMVSSTILPSSLQILSFIPLHDVIERF